MISLLDETDNLTDWHLQSIPLIHFIFIMSFKLLCIIQNGANIKNTPRRALRPRNTINQEGNNTLSTPKLQKNNEKSLVDTVRKMVKEELKEHKTKMSEMKGNNLQNTDDRLDKISKEMTELDKSIELDQLKGQQTILLKTLNIWKQVLKESKMMRYSNFEPGFKLRWCRARDLFGSQIPVTAGGFEL